MNLKSSPRQGVCPSCLLVAILVKSSLASSDPLTIAVEGPLEPLIARSALIISGAGPLDIFNIFWHWHGVFPSSLQASTFCRESRSHSRDVVPRPTAPRVRELYMRMLPMHPCIFKTPGPSWQNRHDIVYTYISLKGLCIYCSLATRCGMPRPSSPEQMRGDTACIGI